MRLGYWTLHHLGEPADAQNPFHKSIFIIKGINGRTNSRITPRTRDGNLNLSQLAVHKLVIILGYEIPLLPQLMKAFYDD